MIGMATQTYQQGCTGPANSLPSYCTSSSASSTGSAHHGMWYPLTHLPTAIWHMMTTGVSMLFDQMLLMVAHFIEWVLVGLLDFILKHDITVILQNAPWAQALLTVCISVAFGLLGIRLMWECFRIFAAREAGGTEPYSDVFRGAIWSGAAIVTGPWLCLHAIEFANALTMGVIHVLSPMIGPQMLPSLLGGIAAQALAAGVGVGGAALGVAATVPVLGVTLVGTPLVIAVALIPVTIFIILLVALMFLIAIRSAEFLFAAFLAPFAALGYMSGNEGMARDWFQNVGILVGSQVVQVIFLYGSIGVLGTPGVFWPFRFFLSLGMLVVALRGPHMLRQYTYHTGTGSVAMRTGQMAIQAMNFTKGTGG